MLTEMGLSAGQETELIPGTELNKYGFFERREMLLTNEKLIDLERNSLAAEVLRNIGWSEQNIDGVMQNWRWVNRCNPLPVDTEVPIPLQSSIKQLADRALTDSQINVWKDARFSITLPVWKKYINPICILLWRHPVEAANSLQRMTSIPVKAGLNLWSCYNRSAVEVSEGLPRIIVSHQDLISKPASVAENLFDFLSKNGIPIHGNVQNASRAIDIEEYHYRAASNLNKEPVDETLLAWLNSNGAGELSAAPGRDGLDYLGMIAALKYQKYQLDESIRNRGLLKSLFHKLRINGFIRKILNLIR